MQPSPPPPLVTWVAYMYREHTIGEKKMHSRPSNHEIDSPQIHCPRAAKRCFCHPADLDAVAAAATAGTIKLPG